MSIGPFKGQPVKRLGRTALSPASLASDWWCRGKLSLSSEMSVPQTPGTPWVASKLVLHNGNTSTNKLLGNTRTTSCSSPRKLRSWFKQSRLSHIPNRRRRQATHLRWLDFCIGIVCWGSLTFRRWVRGCCHWSVKLSACCARCFRSWTHLNTSTSWGGIWSMAKSLGEGRLRQGLANFRHVLKHSESFWLSAMISAVEWATAALQRPVSRATSEAPTLSAAWQHIPSLQILSLSLSRAALIGSNSFVTALQTRTNRSDIYTRLLVLQVCCLLGLGTHHSIVPPGPWSSKTAEATMTASRIHFKTYSQHKAMWVFVPFPGVLWGCYWLAKGMGMQSFAALAFERC